MVVRKSNKIWDLFVGMSECFLTDSIQNIQKILGSLRLLARITGSTKWPLTKMHKTVMEDFLG
jgi:hypothetical protein